MTAPIKRTSPESVSQEPEAKRKLTQIEQIAIETLDFPDFLERYDALQKKETPSAVSVKKTEEILKIETVFNEKRTGYFKAEYPSGEHYEGNFVNGLPHGQGRTYGADGLLHFEGGFWKNNVHGLGTEFWPNGKVKYTGKVQDKAYDGFGEYYSETGELIFSGYWVRGYRYIGQLNHQKPEGYGSLLHFDGSTLYSGLWLAGSFHGPGVLYFQNGHLSFMGYFKDGFKHGHGTELDEMGNSIEGYWYNDQRFVGQWKDGKPHGVGVLFSHYHYPLYKGSFMEGKCHGFGEHFQQNGNTYLGEFNQGDYHGQGKLLDKDGKILQEGRWARGNFVG